MYLKTLWSHCRNINVVVTETVIKYNIPIYSEKGTLGKVKSIIVKDHGIELEFYIAKCSETKKVIKEVKNKILYLE
jgi:hypothetical protein